MNLFNQNILYSIPDVIGSFGDCSLNSSVIQYSNKHYSQDNFPHIPNTVITLITTYTNELFGCIQEFQTRYRKLRHEFKSKLYSLVTVEGADVFYEAYDQGDDDCLYEFLIPRVKHELCYVHDGEAFENSCYDDILEHIKYYQIDCTCFKELFTFF